MNSLSIITLIISILSISIGLFVLSQDYRLKVNRVFFLMCLVGTFWLLLAGKCYTADTKQELIFWFRIGSIGATFFWAVNLHFYIRLENIIIKNWQIALLYFPGLFVIYPAFASLLIFSDFISYNSQWKFIPASNNIFFYLFIIYNLTYTFSFLILLFRRAEEAGCAR